MLNDQSPIVIWINGNINDEPTATTAAVSVAEFHKVAELNSSYEWFGFGVAN